MATLISALPVEAGRPSLRMHDFDVIVFSRLARVAARRIAQWARGAVSLEMPMKCVPVIKWLSLFASMLLLGLALMSAATLVSVAASIVRPVGSTFSLWYVFVVAGLVGAIGAATRGAASVPVNASAQPFVPHRRATLAAPACARG